MYAKDLRRDDGSDGKSVEYVDKGFPRFDIGSTLTLIVEPVYCLLAESRIGPTSCDVGAFMVTSEKEEVFGKFNLVA